MMTILSENGSVVNFYSLENKQIGEDNPEIQTFGAIHFDAKDSYDEKPYIYTAFLMKNEMQLVKLAQEVPTRTNEFPHIEYHYKFNDYTIE